MKRIFFLSLIVLLIAYSSCQKENSAGRGQESFHVSFTVNGVSKSYTAYTGATFDTSGGFITLTLLGANSSTSFDDYLGFYLDNSPAAKPIVAGEYKDTSTSFTLLTSYTVGGIAHEAGQSVAEDAANSSVIIVNHFKVNITSLTTQTIKGTFSGDYYKDGDLNSTKLTITNGSFYVKII